MNLKTIGVNWNGRVLQIDRDLDGVVDLLRRKAEEGMLVKLQMGADVGQVFGGGHASILSSLANQSGALVALSRMDRVARAGAPALLLHAAARKAGLSP
jgi:hypothetical protein